MFDILGSGAEAIIYLEGKTARKERVRKSYRIPEIDLSLRKSRTRREARIIKKLEKVINVPGLQKISEYEIVMDKIDGDQLKSILDDDPEKAALIGEALSKMHDKDVIHGDLTTSNMIFNGKLFLIDFGLSFISSRIEDKAVDIHLFRQALESKHYRVFDRAYKAFLKGYNPGERKEILARLKAVEARGRNKERI